MRSIWNNTDINENENIAKIFFRDRYYYVRQSEKYKTLEFFMDFMKFQKRNRNYLILSLLISVTLLVAQEYAFGVLVGITSIGYFFPLFELSAMGSFGIEGYNVFAEFLEKAVPFLAFFILGVRLL